jgi:hypothetical protein
LPAATRRPVVGLITIGRFRSSAPKAENGFVAPRIVSWPKADETIRIKTKRFQLIKIRKQASGRAPAAPGRTAIGRSLDQHGRSMAYRAAISAGTGTRIGEPQ